MYRDRLMNRLPAGAPAAAIAPKQRRPVVNEAVVAAPSLPSSSSSATRPEPANRADRDWTQIKRTTSHWTGKAFVSGSNGTMKFISKNQKSGRFCRYYTLRFPTSVSVFPWVSLKVELEVTPPDGETNNGPSCRRKRPEPIVPKPTSLRFIMDSVLQISKHVTVEKCFRFADEKSNVLDVQAPLEDETQIIHVGIRWPSFESQCDAIMEKLRMGDRFSREAEQQPQLPQRKSKDQDDAANDQPRMSNKRFKLFMALRWYYTAMLLVSEENTEPDGLFGVLTSRIASTWNKLGHHRFALEWTRHTLKWIPDSFHARLNHCQALAGLKLWSEVVQFGKESLDILKHANPILQLVKRAAAQEKDQEEVALFTPPWATSAQPWDLVDDATQHIFSYLERSELCDVSQVCRRWAEIAIGRVAVPERVQREPTLARAFKLLRAESSLIVLPHGADFMQHDAPNSYHRYEYLKSTATALVERALNECNPQLLAWALRAVASSSEYSRTVLLTDRTILAACIQKGDLSLVRTVLESGANPNQYTTATSYVDELAVPKRRPLQLALSDSNSTEMAQLLVRFGADPTLVLEDCINEKLRDHLERALSLITAKTKSLVVEKCCNIVLNVGWLDGLQILEKHGILHRYPGGKEALLQSILTRLKGFIAEGATDELWMDRSKVAFTEEAIKLILSAMPYGSIPKDSAVWQDAAQLDEVLVTSLEALLRGMPPRQRFCLYSVDCVKNIMTYEEK